MISEAPLAISVPVIPIENPTSALDKAGASFVPSPVTATLQKFREEEIALPDS